MKKNDIRMLIGIFLLVGICFASYHLFFHKAGANIVIKVNGKVQKTLPLSKNTTLRIRGYKGGYNILQIKNGYASIKDADCPDKLCVHQKRIRYSGESLVCLPHRVIVTITTAQKKSLDGTAY